MARRLENLYSLDLSFCTKVTPTGIVNLLETRGNSLAELRLQSCRNLSIGNAQEMRPRRHRHGGPAAVADPGSAGRAIVKALQSLGESSSCCLSALDVRDCSGQPPGGLYSAGDPFVVGLAELGFQQRVAGYFDRPARWDAQIERRLVEQLLSETPHTEVHNNA